MKLGNPKVVLTLILMVLATIPGHAQAVYEPYTFITIAGNAGYGSDDGVGSAAHFDAPESVTVDGQGNVYVADSNNSTIRKVTPAGVVTTLAGLAGVAGTNNGTGSAAQFNHPTGVTVDNAGNVYVADTGNSTIRKVTAAGEVTTLAGLAGVAGTNSGTGSAARFNNPSGVAVDGSGNVYVADLLSHRIRKVTAEGKVTTLAGKTGISGSVDGTGSAARFAYPHGVAVDRGGNVYVADANNSTIRKVTPTGEVTTLAGLAGNTGSTDEKGSAARFSFPSTVAVDDTGNVYVADTSNRAIRKVTPTGVVTTLAGDANANPGSVDGTGSAARFAYPHGVAADNTGSVYVADTGNNTIRKVTPSGVTTTFAGLAGSFGDADGIGSAARFGAQIDGGPSDVAVDGAGNVYAVDTNNRTIRKVTPAGEVTTLAGDAHVNPANVDGTGNAARFAYLKGVAVDTAGNVFVADGSTIRKVTPTGEVTTLAGDANANSSITDGTRNTARFANLKGLTVDITGNLYAVDDSTIRKVSPAGEVTTLAGLAGSGSTDGIGMVAQFYDPYGLAVDNSGNLYVADTRNHTIRKMMSTGEITTLAGLAGSLGSADGTGNLARFAFPHGLAVDSIGNVYVTDSSNSTIRKVTPAGVVTTLAGKAGTAGSADGTGSAARFAGTPFLPMPFSGPTGVAVDNAGSVYVADYFNHTTWVCTLLKLRQLVVV